MEMEKNPILTIVTPYYNQKDFISKTIKSVLNQTLDKIEYIVVDDGSSDGGIKQIRRFSNEIKIIQQTNKGQILTQNNIWKNARGKYIGYLSSDDLVHYDCYEKLVNFLEENNEVTMVYPQNHLIDADGKIIKKNVCKDFQRLDCIKNSELYISAGAIFRKSYFIENGGWDHSYKIQSDRSYYVKMSKKHKIYMLKNALGYYRQHKDSGVVKIKGHEVYLEYIRFLDETFSIEEFNLNFRNLSYSNAYFKVSISAFRNLEIKSGFKYYLKSIILDYKKINPYYFVILLRRIISPLLRILISKF